MLYTYSFLDDFVVLYPVYTLLFSDTGLSIWQISSLFVLWSVAGMLMELPAGALADATSRRALLALGPLLTAVAFGLWVGFPNYWIFLLGFLLWGLKGAMTSGALEALVYEDLQRLDATPAYATLMGRAKVAAVLAAMAASAVAAPALTAGGYTAVGVASVAACLLASLTATLFPEHRIRGDTDTDDEPGWAATLTAGLTEARRTPRVRSAVILVAVVAAIWGALDEYTPLLLSSTGISDVTVSLLMVLIWAGAGVGGLLAGRAARLGSPALGTLIFCGAALLAVGALMRHPAGALAIAAAFGIFQLTTIVTDARLQDSITGPARATVTSMAGMATDALTLAVYGSYAALAGFGGHSGAFALLTLPYLVMSLWLWTIRPLTSTAVEDAASSSHPDDEEEDHAPGSE